MKPKRIMSTMMMTQAHISHLVRGKDFFGGFGRTHSPEVFAAMKRAWAVPAVRDQVFQLHGEILRRQPYMAENLPAPWGATEFGE